MRNIQLSCLLTFLASAPLFLIPSYAEDGYKLWLRDDPSSIAERDRLLTTVELACSNPGEVLQTAARELKSGLVSMGRAANDMEGVTAARSLKIHTLACTDDENLIPPAEDTADEGYTIRTDQDGSGTIAARGDEGALYGIFHYLRLARTGAPLDGVELSEKPKIDLRLINHWDNLDRTVERGYAGFSLWDWHKLPDFKDQRYTDYARANASIGINGVSLTNVNANATVLTAPYIEKVAALADVFRPYGIKTYLTARFSAPIEIGGLETADPLNPDVRRFWRD